MASKGKAIKKLADEYFPKIFRESGKLDSDYQHVQALKFAREVLEMAALVAEKEIGQSVTRRVVAEEIRKLKGVPTSKGKG